MPEQFANNRASTLNGGINSAVTTVTVNDGSVFPSVGTYRVIVDTELMLVTARTGNDLTVTRGAEGTTPASHSNAAAVTMILTAGAFDQRRIDDCGAGSISNRPSTGKEGRLYLPNDGLTVHRDTGAVWTPYGLAFKFKQPPALNAFTWVNQGSAAAADQGGTITLREAAHNSENVRALVKSLPSAPYTVTAAFRPWIDHNGTGLFCSFGMCLRESSSGKLLLAGWRYTQNGGPAFELANYKYSSPTVSAAPYVAREFGLPLDVLWVRIEDDNTNRKILYSPDGIEFFQVSSESRTTHLTADQCGFYLNNNQTATSICDSMIRLLSWEEQN